MDENNMCLHSMSVSIGDKFQCAFQVYTGQNKYEKVNGVVDEILLAGGQIGIQGAGKEYWYISIDTYFRSNIVLKSVYGPEKLTF